MSNQDRSNLNASDSAREAVGKPALQHPTHHTNTRTFMVTQKHTPKNVEGELSCSHADMRKRPSRRREGITRRSSMLAAVEKHIQSGQSSNLPPLIPMNEAKDRLGLCSSPETRPAGDEVPSADPNELFCRTRDMAEAKTMLNSAYETLEKGQTIVLSMKKVKQSSVDSHVPVNDRTEEDGAEGSVAASATAASHRSGGGGDHRRGVPRGWRGASRGISSRKVGNSGPRPAGFPVNANITDSRSNSDNNRGRDSKSRSPKLEPDVEEFSSVRPSELVCRKVEIDTASIPMTLAYDAVAAPYEARPPSNNRAEGNLTGQLATSKNEKSVLDMVQESLEENEAIVWTGQRVTLLNPELGIAGGYKKHADGQEFCFHTTKTQ